MCGFARRIQAAKIPKLERIRLQYDLADFPDGQYWPGTKLTGVIVGGEGGTARTIEAIWWFLLQEKGGQLKPNRDVTCFNARNLGNSMWKGPLRTHRCILPATSIVETLKGESFHMEAAGGLLLGGLYRAWKHGDDVVHSCAIITCPPHHRFRKYHDKSTPLFLPDDQSIIAAWLDPTFHEAEYFRGLIDHPKLTDSFQVSPVKNSQNLTPLGAPEVLAND